MFSEHYLSATEEVYRALHFADEAIRKKGMSRERLAELTEKSENARLTLQELAEVARATQHADFLEGLVRKKYRSGSGEVRYIAPTFQTNNCIDICNECGWSRHANAERVMLSPEQFGSQLAQLNESGFGVIEISNGTMPRLLEWATLRKYMDFVPQYVNPEKGGAFGICSATFDDEVFARLFPKIAQFWVQWMETYDLGSYFRVHRFSAELPQNLQRFAKANFMSRLNSYDTVMELGGNVMLGVQYGINYTDPAFDALMTIVHARYLFDRYGRAPLTFGTVKNNRFGGNTESYSEKLPYKFSDEEYRTLLVAYKLGMPEVGRWLNTRVPFPLIEGAIVDGDVYTGECSEMVPGRREGLVLLGNKEAGQFSVHELSKKDWESKLARLGLSVNYAWMNKEVSVEVDSLVPA